MLIFFPWPLWKSRWIKRQNCDKYRNKCSKYSTNVLGTQLVTGGFLGCSPRLRATWSLRVLCAERNSHLWTLAPSQQLVCRWTVVRLFYHLLDLNSVHPKTDQDFNALNNLNMKFISMHFTVRRKQKKKCVEKNTQFHAHTNQFFHFRCLFWGLSIFETSFRGLTISTHNWWHLADRVHL